MTRDSAAVAALDDRRRRCPISAASNVVDDASILMTNSITRSGSSSNDDVGGGDEGGSLKSSSEVSTTTSCCGGSSSSSSRSGSDDDDSATVTRLSTANEDSCSATIKTPIVLQSLHKQIEDDNVGGKDSSSSSRSDEAAAPITPTKIGGRLTFYKDGKFIFQLAAHHQQNSYNNPSALTSPCRWVPVPTVIQQHKNNVKCIGEWSQNQQNKTIWPYLVNNTASDSKSPQPIQQSQPPTVRIGERKQQQFQHRTTPPPLSLITGAVNTAGGIVVATTTNIMRRPSRKCSTTVAADNVTDFQHKHYQPPTQSRGLPRRSQQHQHQAFMMIATEAIKVQRRLLSLPKKQRLWCQRKRKSLTKNAMIQELKPPKINLECVVRNLWCRRHTTELLLRRQLSINNSGDTVAAGISTVVDVPPVVSRHVSVSSASVVDSMCSNMGSSKRRSMVSPSLTTATPIPVTATTINLSNKSGNSSPHKKYKLGHQQSPEQLLLPQRRLAVDKNVKNAIPQPPPQAMSTNDHSITAILSGGAAGAKRSNGSGALSMVMDPENCVITTPTSTSTILSPHKHLNTPSSAPLSLLRTLLKSPSSESGSPPIAASTNGVGYRHHTNGSRKRSSVESTVLSLPSMNATAVNVENGLGTSAMGIPPVGTNAADNASAVLTALHQLPTIHHPAAGQLAAAGYFNVLYHQAAMAAAMAYQTHAQLPQPLPKSQPPPLLSSQFSTTSGATSTWQRQLNRRPPLLHPPEAIVGSGVTNATISSSASTVVAPYSSPLIAATVNGSSLLPPATPSPPPSLMLHPHPVHPHHLLLHHQQQYQPMPTVQQQSSFHRQQGSSVKKRTGVAIGVTEYSGCIAKNNTRDVATLDEESSSSADCMPLNLSKDSIAENVSGTSPTARVR
ncbi:protein hairless-like [Melanaphis sacchari]|uniref:protein hairless-like n=1 Tax=Melanaphis sacchari TaxID=742174 RepID=UPI000DC143B2|nr:protein hairless-like [Melanaphis sacchari]